MNTIFKIDTQENTQIHINSIKNKDFEFSIAIYDVDAEEYLPSVKMFKTAEDVLKYLEKNLPKFIEEVKPGAEFLSAEGKLFQVMGELSEKPSFFLLKDPETPKHWSIMSKDEIKHTAWREYQNLFYRLKIKLESAKEDEIAEAKEAERRDVDGFDAEMTPLQRGKALAFLNRQVRHEGQIITRKALIKKYINEGWLMRYPSTKERIFTDDECYITQKDWIGKIGMDYAEYLLCKKGLLA